MATKKKAAKKTTRRPPKPRKQKTGRKAPTKRTPAKAATKRATKKAAPKKGGGPNKLGVKNSLVNNINARKKKGIARKKKDSEVNDDQYRKMKDNWGK